jgi:hypothetical protein
MIIVNQIKDLGNYKQIIGMVRYQDLFSLENFYPFEECVEHFFISGYDSSEISIKCNNYLFKEYSNLTWREFRGYRPLQIKQKYTYDINIDGQEVHYFDEIPDTVVFKSHKNKDIILPFETIYLDWNDVENADYYYIELRIFINTPYVDNKFIYDVTYESNMTIPSGLIYHEKAFVFVIVYAVSGPPPNVTNISNIEGEIDGRVYFYSATSIRLLTEKYYSKEINNIHYGHRGFVDFILNGSL